MFHNSLDTLWDPLQFCNKCYDPLNCSAAIVEISQPFCFSYIQGDYSNVLLFSSFYFTSNSIDVSGIDFHHCILSQCGWLTQDLSEKWKQRNEQLSVVHSILCLSFQNIFTFSASYIDWKVLLIKSDKSPLNKQSGTQQITCS